MDILLIFMIVNSLLLALVFFLLTLSPKVKNPPYNSSNVLSDIKKIKEQII